MPNAGDQLTQDQVNKITNWSKYAKNLSDITIDKPWHQGQDTGGQFEGWATQADSGYTNGYPLYAGVSISGKKIHVYWLPKTGEMKLADTGENPLNT